MQMGGGGGGGSTRLGGVSTPITKYDIITSYSKDTHQTNRPYTSRLNSSLRKLY